MGGAYSGTRDRKKHVVESFESLDVTAFSRCGPLVPGTNYSGIMTQGRDPAGNTPPPLEYTLVLGADRGILRVRHACAFSPEPVEYAIALVTTKCYRNGRRWWFTCPLVSGGSVCGRRVRKLYRWGWHFGCRQCYDLVYTSSQRSDSRVYAILRNEYRRRYIAREKDRSLSETWLILKVFEIEQKRLSRGAC